MPDTARIGSDLAKVDAHDITREEYEEIPELTEEWFARADLYHGGKLIRRGRPPLGEAAKRQVTLRLAPDVLDPFKDSGPGWQTRIEDTLRAALQQGRAAGVGAAGKRATKGGTARAEAAKKSPPFRAKRGA